MADVLDDGISCICRVRCGVGNDPPRDVVMFGFVVLFIKLLIPKEVGVGITLLLMFDLGSWSPYFMIEYITNQTIF